MSDRNLLWDTIEVALKNERSALCDCDVCKPGRDSIDAALAFVRKMRQQTREWKPVEDGTYESHHQDRTMIVEREWLVVKEAEAGGVSVELALPDNIRLCRRTA